MNRRAIFLPQKEITTKLSDLSSMGARPHSPTIRLYSQMLSYFRKKTYICNTQRQPAERYGRVAKNKLPGRIDGVPTSLAAFFFPIVLVRLQSFLLPLVHLVYLHTSPNASHKSCKTKYRQKYYQFHNLVTLIF